MLEYFIIISTIKLRKVLPPVEMSDFSFDEEKTKHHHLMHTGQFNVLIESETVSYLGTKICIKKQQGTTDIGEKFTVSDCLMFYYKSSFLALVATEKIP